MPEFHRKIKTLIVDDSVVFREALYREMLKDRDIEVIAMASNPYEALDLISRRNPDVIVTDINMPKMNGLDFIKKIVQQNAIPIVCVSSDAELLSRSLRCGAAASVEKPGYGPRRDFSGFARVIVEKIKQNVTTEATRNGRITEPGKPTIDAGSGNNAARSLNRIDGKIIYAQPQKNINVFDVLRPDRTETRADANLPVRSTDKRIIVIGASTGGTDAVAAIVGALPSGLPGILIVQHMPGDFTGLFANRLNALCAFPVREAKTGDRIQPSMALVAPGNYQLKVVGKPDGYSVVVYAGEKVSGHSPSVDVAFTSVAAVYRKNAIGVILTGMGRDGANGLLEMRKAGAKTIGQDEASSIVYGMPKVAYEEGAVMVQASLDQIAAKILSLL